ncbi:hypothetical protein [Streptomyces sp. NPDC090445]|uniref:hypothetical protein n=1 Tax=Streptomyces sp. NPDC090445 TaxID=3365963 RepID=UPI003808E62B
MGGALAGPGWVSLRDRLPEHAHAAGYSMMYAVQGAGYSLTASLSALVLRVADASTAILGGVVVAVVITAVSALAERGPARVGRPLGAGQDAPV